MEALHEQISRLRKEALTARSLARAFSEYADDVEAIPTKGDVADMAGVMLAKFARARAEAAREVEVARTAEADEMEGEFR